MTLSETRPATARAVAPSRLRWLYPVALAAMVVVASGRSQIAAPPIVDIDKLVHFSVFGLMATLVARSPGMKHAWVAALVVSVFGITDELRQSFTPGRSVEFADWMADTTGASVAVGLYTFWAWYRRLLETPLRLRPRRAVTKVSASDAVPVSNDVSAPAA